MNKIMGLAAIASIVFVLAFAASLTQLNNQATAQETTPFPSREKVISVTGTATTSVDPDLLVIQFGVETQEITAKQALESNSNLMNSVVTAITSAGISQDDISTSRFNIQPIYDSYQDKQTGRYTQELKGYRVSNIVMVETKSLNSAADIIDGGVSAGANRVDSVYFTLSPQKQLEVKDNLISQAVKNAEYKANKALGPLNHKIIGVKAISLSEFGIPYPQPLYSMDGFAKAESSFAPTPVFSSDQDVTTTANVIFLIGSN
ncbi:MAG: SIMPL domain-containing protein [Nitrosopumilaceae archaeon]